MSPAPAAGTPCWFDLSTPDLDGATAFYGAILGWTVTDQGPDFGHYRMCDRDGASVAGMAPQQDAAAPPAWMVYLATPDADGAVARATAAGAGLLVPAMDVGPFGRMAVLSDPTGATFGLWQAGSHPGTAAMGAPGLPSWFEVNTPDAIAARDFYAGVFGLSTHKMPGMDYHTLHVPGAEGAETAASYGVLQMNEAWQGMPAHWMVYFAVADVDAAGAQVGALGGQLRHGPFDTPYGRIAVCTDPQGAAFTLIQLAVQDG